MRGSTRELKAQIGKGKDCLTIVIGILSILVENLFSKPITTFLNILPSNYLNLKY